MNLELNQIEYAALQIGLIDSGERDIFLKKVNTDDQVDIKLLCDGDVTGVYFSCFFYGDSRVHVAISCSEDTDRYNEEISSCVLSSLEKTKLSSCSIWIRNENKKVIQYLKERFHIKPDCGNHYYASIEFIMRREQMKATTLNGLEIRTYEEKYIDDYLQLLDESMTFTDPPPNYRGNKEHYLQYFGERNKNKSFESFYKDNQLIGLYWRKNAEIDTLAIATNSQRKGYGSILLTRAIQMIFKNTDSEYAYLYALDWNEKGQNFYTKYGMEQNSHSYRLCLKIPEL
jgi:ribosomal protein S18 acetylase RimI-like enzyme